MLAGRVHRRAQTAFVAERRRQVDDAAAALAGHHPQFMLHAEQGAEDVGVEGGGVALGGLVGHRSGLAFGAGVVDRHIQPAEPRHGLVDQGADVVFVAYVGAQERGFGAEAAQFFRQRLAGFVAAAGDDDPRPITGESQRGGSADARQGAGDQDDFCAHGTVPCGVAVALCASVGAIWTSVFSRSSTNTDVRILFSGAGRESELSLRPQTMRNARAARLASG
jgi:hypothetical protein